MASVPGMPDMASLSPEERRAYEMLQQRQLQEFVQTYNAITQKCFDNCISDFTARTLKPKESKCVEHCMGKYLKTSERIGQRLGEHMQAQQNQ